MSTRHQTEDGSPRAVPPPRAAPPISYPAELPVSQKKDEIAAAIREHQVVIVAGETGSGKTTQLPKICLELGRGSRRLIGHTQPRRLAARTVAERIADELHTPLGGTIGYQVRFTDKVSRTSMVKVMTDGILLNEIQQDRHLRRYDTLIIDEAHERSLNIDFILGHLTQLLPRRPDLKLIITSATIDPERFAQHFSAHRTDGVAAPIVEVSGRTYPVEVRYRPIPDTKDADGSARDQIQAIGDAVAELRREPPGDILVFASGEREIRDTADALRKMALPNTEILPLYARLSAAEQRRVFQPHTARRIVLATNVAETSLTVPGIRYVIDPGAARISRYSHRTKVQRLPIEAISQASANQRKGRCGRTSDGICVRLYSEADFATRPEFTDPEILRTNLASVILQMTAAKLGDIERFGFIDPPDRRNITDGVRLLTELGAVEPANGPRAAAQAKAGSRATAAAGKAGSRATAKADAGRLRLTTLGRRLAQLPVDPRLGRMVLEAERNSCVPDVLIIVSALAIQDPRERPADQQQAADAKHARFACRESDFLPYLRLWRYLAEQQKTLSSNQFRKLCKAEFLHYLRIREWQDVHSQLRQTAKALGISVDPKPVNPRPVNPKPVTATAGGSDEPVDSARIHTSLLAGLLSHIGVKEAPRRNGQAAPDRRGGKHEYLGARNARFAIFPGSALFKKPPQWVMAAELVETSRLWGRIAARIEPEWIEPLAGHLIKRSHSEPHWEKKQGAVMAYEKVTLHGVPIVARRKINYGRIDPELSRELFLRHALVEGDWDTHHAFLAHNQAMVDEVEELEHRSRRPDIMVDDQALYDFYDQRVPREVVSGRHFDSWWKQARRDDPQLLDFPRSLLRNPGVGHVDSDDYPDFWEQDGLRLRVSYQFEPGADQDGVTVHVPLPLLGRVSESGFDWQVPGLREQLVTTLIRSLPKPLRRHFVPVPDHAHDVLAEWAEQPDVARRHSLLGALELELERISGVRVPRQAWQPDQTPEHLKISFRVSDEDGRVLGEGKDLTALQQRLAPRSQEAISAAAESVDQQGLRSWSFDALPATIEQHQAGHRLTGYPALVDEGDSVAVRTFATAAEQEQAMWPGTRRMLLLHLPSPVACTQGRLSNQAKLALSRNPHRSVAELLQDCAACALDDLIADAGGPVWDKAGFERLRDAVRPELTDAVLEIVHTVEKILNAAHAVQTRLKESAGPATLPARADIRAQLSQLIYPGFVTDTGAERLPDLARYLKAAQTRLDKLPGNPERDLARMREIHEVQQEHQELLSHVRGVSQREAARQIRWMIEELRVSYFAQQLKTAYPISVTRVLRAIDDLFSDG